MSPTLVLSATLITLALVFYSLGVWAERLARLLKPWHVVVFWTGLAFDLSGTLANTVWPRAASICGTAIRSPGRSPSGSC